MNIDMLIYLVRNKSILMKPQFPFFILLTMLLSFSFTATYAAFPANTQAEHTTIKEQKTFKQTLKQAVLDYKKTAPSTTGVGGNAAANAFGLVSLIAGVLGLIFMFIPGIGIIFIPLAVAAFVFGILGLKGSNKGMAIAGLILGAVELLILLIAVAFVAAFISSL